MTIGKKAKYLEDYDIVKQTGKQDTLVYRGDIYAFDMDAGAFLRYKRIMLLFPMLYIFLWGLASVSDPSSLRGDTSIYVALPYVALCFPIILCMGRAIHLQKQAQQLERIDYDQSVVSLNLCTLVTILAGAAAGAAQAVYIFLSQSFKLSEWFAALCFLMIALLAFASYRLQSRFPCTNIGKINSSC